MESKIVVSESGRKRFVKDFSLPISVLSDPYFSYFIELYEPLFQSKTKFEEMCKMIQLYGNEGNFFQKCNEISDKVIKAIESTVAYRQFNNDPNLIKKYLIQTQIPNQTIYQMNNVDNYFISIDIRHANFNAMKFHNKEMVLGCESYEELISKFDDNPYFSKSKYVRQVIFGKLNPKRQQRIQQYLISLVIDTILGNGENGFIKENFITASSDEVVLKTHKDKIDSEIKLIRKILDEKLPNLSPIFKIEGFTLKSIQTKSGKPIGFVKEKIGSNEIEFKTVPTYLFAQAYKKYKNEKITDFDKYFTFDGMLCKVEEELF